MEKGKGRKVKMRRTHFSKDRVFVDSSVLYTTSTLPNNLLVLLKPPVQQKNLVETAK